MSMGVGMSPFLRDNPAPPCLNALPHPPAGAAGRGVDVGQLIHRYAKEFLYTDASLALEYYMLAADAMGGSVQVGQGWGGCVGRREGN